MNHNWYYKMERPTLNNNFSKQKAYQYIVYRNNVNKTIKTAKNTYLFMYFKELWKLINKVAETTKF